MDDLISKRAARREQFGNSEHPDCSDCVNHGGDWDCDHVHCRKGTDTISRKAAIDAIEEIDCSDWDGRLSALKCDAVDEAVATIKALPPAETKGYTKADYIMALHKEYGVDFARAEEAHNRALEYLRSTAMMKG